MNFGVILAGGIGSRMGNVEKPKRYLTVGDKPIIVHTIEKFYVNSNFEKTKSAEKFSKTRRTAEGKVKT